MIRKDVMLDDNRHMTAVLMLLVVVFAYGVLVGFGGRGIVNAGAEHHQQMGFGRFADVARTLETSAH